MKRLQYMHRGRSTYAIPRENFYTSVPTYAIFQVKISLRVCPPWAIFQVKISIRVILRYRISLKMGFITLIVWSEMLTCIVAHLC